MHVCLFLSFLSWRNQQARSDSKWQCDCTGSPEDTQLPNQPAVRERVLIRHRNGPLDNQAGTKAPDSPLIVAVLMPSQHSLLLT